MSKVSFDLAFGLNGSIHPLQSSFSPIPELRRPDADVFLFFLSAFDVQFAQPEVDPWYQATTPYGQPLQEHWELVGNTSIYMKDKTGSPLTWVEQHQVCSSGAFGDKEPCTPLMSFEDLINLAYISARIKDDIKRDGMIWTFQSTISKMLQVYHPIAVIGTQALVLSSNERHGRASGTTSRQPMAVGGAALAFQHHGSPTTSVRGVCQWTSRSCTRTNLSVCRNPN
ncbi:hypothetical protein B0H63DRAFT_130426 [Podospora didyma]|uniref:Uncharacterized protein n=1 Tax=Podospora didyma TaxID=330526 RepID=A0AAE0P0D6_9PEZI|nr:hypothetical protein B0H63DRAFT_130426 [Podospora didyma]